MLVWIQNPIQCTSCVLTNKHAKKWLLPFCCKNVSSFFSLIARLHTSLWCVFLPQTEYRIQFSLKGRVHSLQQVWKQDYVFMWAMLLGSILLCIFLRLGVYQFEKLPFKRCVSLHHFVFYKIYISKCLGIYFLLRHQNLVA